MADHHVFLIISPDTLVRFVVNVSTTRYVYANLPNRPRGVWYTAKRPSCGSDKKKVITIDVESTSDILVNVKTETSVVRSRISSKPTLQAVCANSISAGNHAAHEDRTNWSFTLICSWNIYLHHLLLLLQIYCCYCGRCSS